MATLDLFATAKTVTVTKPKKATDRTTIHTPGLSGLAAIRALIGTLEGYAATLDASVKETAFGKWIEEALRTKTQPKGFDLVDDNATGKYSYKKRSSLSVIPEDALPMLDALKIPYEMKEVTPDHWFINPEILEDEKAREELNKWLGKSTYLKGKTILCHQEAVSKPVTTDATISTACQVVKTADQMKAIGSTIGVHAVSTMFDSEETKDAFAVLEAIGIKLVPDAKPAAKGKKG